MTLTASSDTLTMKNDVEKANGGAEQVPTAQADSSEKQESTEALPPTQEVDKHLVFLDPHESPYNFSMVRKIAIVFVMSCGALCSTFASSIVS